MNLLPVWVIALALIYKRRSAHSGAVEILGDRPLLDFWLERVSFA